ncbi:MAG: putative bifunctional diguanylate cyclase/phosphodiesterase [Actinomycetota bacterium]
MSLTHLTAGDGYRSLFENAVEGMYRTTPDGRYLAANRALARIYGYASAAELVDLLTDIGAGLYVDPGDRERFKQALTRSDVVQNFEARVRRKDGKVIWISENARAVHDDDGRLLCYEGTVQDITQRKTAEERLRLAGTVFDSVVEAVVVIDRAGTVKAVNPAFERMTGWVAAEVVDAPFAAVEPLTLAGEIVDPAAWIASPDPFHGELLARRKDGSTFPAAVAASAVPEPAGPARRAVVLLRDVTRRKADEQRIRYQASHDALTGLPNRFTVIEALERAIQRAAAAGTEVLVLFLDINGFKAVNDSLGHGSGDQLLRQAASRLRHCVRMSETVGRFGGDEFVLVVPDVTDRRVADAIIYKIDYAFSEPFRIAGREVFVSPTIGVAVHPDHGTDAAALVSNADAAMYHAKAAGRPFALFDPEMGRQALDRVNLENDLRLALSRRQFRLVYQPKVDAMTGKVVGAEALIRWRHPERGEVSPALFIPVAESAGLIGAIGDWTIVEACRQLAAWRQDGVLLPRLSVNLSPAQFMDPRLWPKIEEALASAGLPAPCLELEITETMMATEVDRAIAILTELRSQGVRVSIDDFGTGYSSLGYLKLFPLDTLKIDQTFVRGLPQDARDGAIVASVVALAGNLGFEVVVEGVETEQQAAFLMGKGCRIMQGYLYSRPLAPDQFGQLAARRGVG